MKTSRLEAFSDGVLAIIITIMVLELKVPHGAQWSDLASRWPIFLSYVLSFLMVGIYWNNHHHLLHIAQKVGGAVLWANLHLLFWLSLLPFGTGWMGENHFAPLPCALYGFNLLACALAYMILQYCIIRTEGEQSLLAKAVGYFHYKDLLPLLAYLLSIPLAFVSVWISGSLWLGIALMWIIPDRRIEKVLAD